MQATIDFIRSFSFAEIERRKQQIRNVWNYKKVDHIPIMINLDYNPWNYTMQQELYDHETQFNLRMHSCERSLKLLPDDYIPSAFINVGCVGISNSFGAKVYKGENPWQTPGIAGTVVKNIEDVYDLEIPNIKETEFTKTYLERLKLFYERTDGSVYLSGLDTNGPISVAMDLIGSEMFFISMYDNPDAILHLIKKINVAIIDTIEAGIEITGDINAFTSSDFFYCWCPEGFKGHVSSDLSASYSPEFFKLFDVPANNPIYKRYGPGLLHNCGPNPCVYEYINHEPPISGINLAYNYSYKDLPDIKKAMRGKIVYFFYEEEAWSALEHYKYTMEQLAPDVIAIPILSVSDETIDPGELYGKFRTVSDEYAKRVFG
jgi:hypothetical protein